MTTQCQCDDATGLTRALLINEARGLKSEHGENIEYDRALVELIYWAAGGASLTAVAREVGVDRLSGERDCAQPTERKETK